MLSTLATRLGEQDVGRNKLSVEIFNVAGNWDPFALLLCSSRWLRMLKSSPWTWAVTRASTLATVQLFQVYIAKKNEKEISHYLSARALSLSAMAAEKVRSVFFLPRYERKQPFATTLTHCVMWWYYFVMAVLFFLFFSVRWHDALLTLIQSKF